MQKRRRTTINIKDHRKSVMLGKEIKLNVNLKQDNNMYVCYSLHFYQLNFCS